MNEPPFMVSRKWVSHPSWGTTWASAAATPPSAITVCALPSSDLHTSPTDTPSCAASIVARRPAPPAPITSTSCSWVSYFSIDILSEARAAGRIEQVERVEHGIVDDAHRAEPHVEVREAHREKAPPGEAHVVSVEDTDDAPGLEPRPAGRDAREAVELAAHQVA